MIDLGPDDAGFVSAAIADAFSDDPVQAWMSGGRSGFTNGLFGMAVPAFLEQGICYATDDRQGLALWLPPHAEPEFPEGLGALRRFLQFGSLGSLWRYSKLERESAKRHPREPHYYLWAIGIRGQNKGKGLGSAVIRHILDRCDAEGRGAYLESSNSRNLSFYQRHGFKVVDEHNFTRSGPSMYFMWRDPHARRI